MMHYRLRLHILTVEFHAYLIIDKELQLHLFEQKDSTKVHMFIQSSFTGEGSEHVKRTIFFINEGWECEIDLSSAKGKTKTQGIAMI